MFHSHQLSRELSLADELGSCPSSLILLKNEYMRDTESPDSERLLTDGDSGHSTAHTPTEGLKSLSPILGYSPGSIGGGIPYPDVEMLEATHRGLHKFVPRHDDEIEVEIGDPIYVQKEADDLWSEGMLIRSNLYNILEAGSVVVTLSEKVMYMYTRT